MTDRGVVVITGAMAAGKSTIAQGLAQRLPRAAHVRGDAFRRMIVSGRASMDPPLSDAAVAQLHLRHRLAALVADEYVAAGITAAVQDLYLGDDLVRFLRLLSSRPIHVVVLAPQAEVLAARDLARGSSGYGAWSAEEFHEALLDETPSLGLSSTTCAAVFACSENSARIWIEDAPSARMSPIASATFSSASRRWNGPAGR
jgi:chloramphenicol 3-O-phosphotransferase